MMFGHWKKWGNWPESEHRWGRGRWGYRRPKYNVPVNIIEHEGEFEVWVYALTFGKENIAVSVVDDTLYITGRRKPEGDDSPNFLLQEYPIKSFERSFELSERVEKSGIQARYEQGILKVSVPKTKSAMEPEIQVNIE